MAGSVLTHSIISSSLCLVWITMSICESASVHIVSESCDAVKYAYGSLNFNRREVPNFKVDGSHLQTCARDRTCCTSNMEKQLTVLSDTDFTHQRDTMMELLTEIFVSRTAKFDKFFTKLLDNSREDLDAMFKKTYGILYIENSYLFMDLFDDLRAYYKGRDMNLLEVLDKFFADLLERMFVLLHSHYRFDEDYLQCLTEHMHDLRPFGDVPSKLSSQIKRSFIAARTFVQGLAVGRDVVTAVAELEMTGECREALVRMTYCSYCAGAPYNKPCSNFCLNVMKGCLAHYADLNDEWNTYLDALKRLAERLEGPFNIEAVVDPIDVKLSDAIMNFQEASMEITERVFEGCGQPPYNNARRKRSYLSGGGQVYEDFADSWRYERQNFDVRPTTAAGTSLDRLVRDIEEQVSTTRDFFKNLPQALCADTAAPVFESDNCWNGMSDHRYLPDVVGDGVQNQINNPEVEVDIRRTNSIINQQLLQLRLITNKLRNAYNGIDVDWIDTSDTIEEPGSGQHRFQGDGIYADDEDFSGSGSGDAPIDAPYRGPGRGPNRGNVGGGRGTEDIDVIIEVDGHVGVTVRSGSGGWVFTEDDDSKSNSNSNTDGHSSAGISVYRLHSSSCNTFTNGVFALVPFMTSLLTATHFLMTSSNVVLLLTLSFASTKFLWR